MITRSSHNWETRSGVFDSLNLRHIPLGDSIELSSIFTVSEPFDVAMCHDYKKIRENSMVSSFVDDYILERFWRRPENYISLFSNAKYVISPDFSLLIGMPRPMLMWNVYRNRLVGHVWKTGGVNVIPSVSWSDYRSFDFCFDGIVKGSTVAISNIGCRSDGQKAYFDDGFEKMMEEISPNQIIFQCNKKYRHYYSQKNIVFLDAYWDSKRKNGR